MNQWFYVFLFGTYPEQFFLGILIVQRKSCKLVIDIYFIYQGKPCSTFTSMYFDCTGVNRNIFLLESSVVNCDTFTSIVALYDN